MAESDQQSPLLVRAGELDAEGRHGDAINELARGAQAGDVAAMTVLARRIIVGDRAPRLTQQGIELLKDAVNRGGAEAAGRLAVIFVAGIAGEPDWAAGMRLLALAAERGWVPARQQLDVMATMAADRAAGWESGDALRATLLQATDPAAMTRSLRQLLLPPSRSVLHADPEICVFPQFVSAAVCDWLIGRSRDRLERALVYDVVRKKDIEDQSRSNSAATFHLMDADMVHLLVQTRIAAACGQPVAHMEAATVLHYSVGEAIGNHYDFVDPEQPGFAEEIRTRGTRVLTFLVYLNSGYSGGETVFPKLGLSHAGQGGEGMYFVNTLRDGQADVRTLHNGQPPTSGEKWIFSQFVRNRPVSIGA